MESHGILVGLFEPLWLVQSSFSRGSCQLIALITLLYVCTPVLIGFFCGAWSSIMLFSLATHLLYDHFVGSWCFARSVTVRWTSMSRLIDVLFAVGKC